MINIRVVVNDKEAQQTFTKIKRNVSDLRPFWRNVLRDYVKNEFLKVFRSNGRGMWAKTTRPNPILRDTRRMVRSYTREGAPGNINRIERQSFVWGTSVPYAMYHETGTSRFPARPVAGLVITKRGFQRQVGRLADEWLEQRINNA